MLDRLFFTTRGKTRIPPIYSPIYDGVTLWYERWYFLLRLEEEVARARRYGLSLTIVVIYIEAGRGNPVGLRDRLRAIATRKLRRSDIPAILDKDELGICLTHTTTVQAETVINRVRRTLAPYDIWVGVANLPEDERSGENLLLIAEHRALASRLEESAG